MRRMNTAGAGKVLSSVLLVTATALLPAQDPFGSGVPGTAAYAPSLSTNGPWMGNYGHALSVHGALPLTYGAFAVSFGRDNSGGPLLVDLGALLHQLVPATTDAMGSCALPLGLGFPAVPTFAGLPIYAQFGCVDPGSLSGIALSPGLACNLAMPPLVFYGSSVGGVNDPWWILDPYSATYATVASGNTNMNNVRSAAWVNGGRELWVACAFAPYLQWLDMTTSPPTRHVIANATEAMVAVHYDRVRGILYSFTDATGALAAYDVLPASPAYGSLLAQMPPAGGSMYMASTIGMRGTRMWRAEALAPFLTVYDMDPASPNWLTAISTINVPMGPSMATVNSLSASDHGSGQLLCTIQGYGQIQGEVARRNLTTNQWIDHNPALAGIQNIGVNAAPPTSPGIAPAHVDIAGDGRHAAVAAIGNSIITAGSSTLAALQLDPADPSAWTCAILPISMDACWTCSFLPDNQSIAFATWAPTQALVVDLAGAFLQLRTLSSAASITPANIYTCVAR